MWSGGARTWDDAEGLNQYGESGKFSPFKFLKENGKLEQLNEGGCWTVRGVTSRMGKSIEYSVYLTVFQYFFR